MISTTSLLPHANDAKSLSGELDLPGGYEKNVLLRKPAGSHIMFDVAKNLVTFHYNLFTIKFPFRFSSGGEKLMQI